MTSDKQIDHVARIATALERIASVFEEIKSDGIDIKTLGDIGLCVVEEDPIKLSLPCGSAT